MENKVLDMLSAMYQEFKKSNEEIKEDIKGINKRLDKVDKRLDEVNYRIGKLEYVVYDGFNILEVLVNKNSNNTIKYTSFI